MLIIISREPKIILDIYLGIHFSNLFAMMLLSLYMSKLMKYITLHALHHPFTISMILCRRLKLGAWGDQYAWFGKKASGKDFSGID